MPKLLIKANELHDTQVDYVSLVKRGANRIPFRLTKQENEDMFDLSTAVRGFVSKSEQKAGVLYAVVSKSADLDAIKAVLTEAGLSVDTMSEENGAIVFTQKGADDFDTGLIKVSDELGLVVSGLTKAFEPYSAEHKDFAEAVKVNGFYPSVRMATEVFSESIYGVMHKADSPSEAASAIGSMVDDFRSYLSTLASSLPVHAFKAEVALTKSEKASGKKGKPKEKDGKIWDAKTMSWVAKTDVKVEVETDDGKGKETEAKEPPKKTGDDDTSKEGKGNDKEPEPAKKAEGAKDGTADALAALTEMLGNAITGMNEKLDNTVAAVKADTKEVSDHLAKLDARIQKSEEAISGTVDISHQSDKTGVQKSDTRRSAPPLLDTGIRKLEE